jgi:hypothetical protein
MNNVAIMGRSTVMFKNSNSSLQLWEGIELKDVKVFC